MVLTHNTLLLACVMACVWAWGDGHERNPCALQIVRGGKPRTTLQHHLFNNVLNVPTLAGSVCVTYADVDAALYAASTRITVTPPEREEWMPEELARVGELLLEASRIIAAQ